MERLHSEKDRGAEHLFVKVGKGTLGAKSLSDRRGQNEEKQREAENEDRDSSDKEKEKRIKKDRKGGEPKRASLHSERSQRHRRRRED